MPWTVNNPDWPSGVGEHLVWADDPEPLTEYRCQRCGFTIRAGVSLLGLDCNACRAGKFARSATEEGQP